MADVCVCVCVFVCGQRDISKRNRLRGCLLRAF